MDSVAVFAPAVSPVLAARGRNATVAVQVPFGASVGWNTLVHVLAVTTKSLPFVPLRIEPTVIDWAALIVMLVVPWLVSVNICVGPGVVPRATAVGYVNGFGVHDWLAVAGVGVRFRGTGEPVIATGWPPWSAVMVTLPVVEPAVVRAR